MSGTHSGSDEAVDTLSFPPKQIKLKLLTASTNVVIIYQAMVSKSVSGQHASCHPLRVVFSQLAYKSCSSGIRHTFSPRDRA